VAIFIVYVYTCFLTECSACSSSSQQAAIYWVAVGSWSWRWGFRCRWTATNWSRC